MPDIYNPNSVPHGMGIFMVGLVPYKVNDPGSSPDKNTTQLIHEPDENGEAQQGRFAIIKGEDLVQRTITLQRVDDSAMAPAEGEVGTYDHDRSGTDSSWIVLTSSTVRGRPDTFEVEVILETYQG